MSYLLLNLMTTYNYEVDIIYNSRNTRLRRDFPRPPGERRRRRPRWVASGAHFGIRQNGFPKWVKECEKINKMRQKKKIDAPLAKPIRGRLRRPIV